MTWSLCRCRFTAFETSWECFTGDFACRWGERVSGELDEDESETCRSDARDFFGSGADGGGGGAGDDFLSGRCLTGLGEARRSR